MRLGTTVVAQLCLLAETHKTCFLGDYFVAGFVKFERGGRLTVLRQVKGHGATGATLLRLARQRLTKKTIEQIDIAFRSAFAASFERIMAVEIANLRLLQEDLAKTIATLQEQVAGQQENDFQLLDTLEFARRLQVSDQTVRNLEKEDRIFSVLPLGRQRGRLYPAFQLREGIVGEPLRAVLKEFLDQGGAVRYQFFSAPNQLLDGLTPVQVLAPQPYVGSTPGYLSKLLLMEEDGRLDAVIKAARTYRGIVEA